jgi:hypothetical protein
MDVGQLNLFLKQLSADYALSQEQVSTLTRRFLADDSEFDRIWRTYKAHTGVSRTGVDKFRPILQELLA